MIKIENTLTPSKEMMQAVIRGMRNPYNSWDKSDNGGPKDHELMLKLAHAGNSNPSHSKFRRMMVVYADVTAPFYWWKEYDTYCVGTVKNSCSTMHSITSKEFTLDDFSHDHIITERSYQSLLDTIDILNENRNAFLKEESDPAVKKVYWYQIIQLLPESYMQKRTLMLSYEVLHKVYVDRKDHKLEEWHTFCDWIKSLPNSDLIV